MKESLRIVQPSGPDNGLDTLPTFHVPGQERDMSALNELHALHHPGAFTRTALWDGWLPHATLWTGTLPRTRYRAAFLERPMDAEGYVSMLQHRGMAHSEGWPFPSWQQACGAGWFFSTHDEDYGAHWNLQPLTSTEGWTIEGAEVLGFHPMRGLQLKATSGRVRISTPPFRCAVLIAPFIRLEWSADGLPTEPKPAIEWLLEGESDWPSGRSVRFDPPVADGQLHYANVPIHRHPGYSGVLTRCRVTIDRALDARIDLKSVITAIDTRHPITNPVYVHGCADYFHWTGDVAFLQANMPRIRTAMRYTLDTCEVRTAKHARVPWVGHDGRSGLVLHPDGQITMRHGLGVGNNYWDLLPFGGSDALATIYVYHALLCMAQLEQTVTRHRDWGIPSGDALDPHDLAALARAVRTDFQKRFWNRHTQRFVGWIDCEGKAYDYGFTFVNLEAICYGLASPAQARSIFAWLDGRRQVGDDTSRGADIYHWRFAPRATTRRNIETYTWPWCEPHKIPWGDQVQDGGAVLGFSYHDLMARLITLGPDDAWKRLQVILNWFREVQSEGGYRAYYAKPGRGLLQGGGPPGGLGLDREFLESVLVPQVMLYGFLGFRPTVDGFSLTPRLPRSWPSVRVSAVYIHDWVVSVTAQASGDVDVTPLVRGARPLEVHRGRIRQRLTH